MAQAYPWTVELAEKILRWWNEGRSAGEIALLCPAVHGRKPSRSAIIGKIYRLQGNKRSPKSRVPRLEARLAQSRKQMATPILRIPSKPKVSIDWDIDPVAVNDDEMPPEKRIKLLDLEPHHCRWGIGDPKKDDFGFCGAQKVPGLSYCMEHARRAYRPPEAPCRSKKSDAAETPEAVDA